MAAARSSRSTRFSGPSRPTQRISGVSGASPNCARTRSRPPGVINGPSTPLGTTANRARTPFFRRASRVWREGVITQSALTQKRRTTPRIAFWPTFRMIGDFIFSAIKS